jgi:hypothetical protein
MAGNLERAQATSQEDAAAIVRELLELELQDEQTRRGSLDQRAVTVVTTSGTLATIVSGIVGLLVRNSHVRYAPGTTALTVSALSSFIVAAILALTVTRPRSQDVADISGLRSLLTPTVFRGPRAAADRRIAEVRLDEISSLRDVNLGKAKRLSAALACQVLALVLLSGAAVSLIQTNAR